MVTHDVLARPLILTLKSLFPDELTVTGSGDVSGGLPLTPLHWVSAPHRARKALHNATIPFGPEMAQPSALCENADGHRTGRSARLGRAAGRPGLGAALQGPSPGRAPHARLPCPGHRLSPQQLTPQRFPGATPSEMKQAIAQKRPADGPPFARPRGGCKASRLGQQPAAVPCTFLWDRP